MDARRELRGADDGSAISCANCQACCCRLEVMLMAGDDIPEELTVQDRWGGWVMRRLEDGWCAALDRNTMRCTIYNRRPDICREYQMGDSDCIGERARFADGQQGVGAGDFQAAIDSAPEPGAP